MTKFSDGTRTKHINGRTYWADENLVFKTKEAAKKHSVWLKDANYYARIEKIKNGYIIYSAEHFRLESKLKASRKRRK